MRPRSVASLILLGAAAYCLFVALTHGYTDVGWITNAFYLACGLGCLAILSVMWLVVWLFAPKKPLKQ